jgi:lysylphosphatidylglycerol synthetase-like protein (DUF2156 family)
MNAVYRETITNTLLHVRQQRYQFYINIFYGLTAFFIVIIAGIGAKYWMILYRRAQEQNSIEQEQIRRFRDSMRRHVKQNPNI